MDSDDPTTQSEHHDGGRRPVVGTATPDPNREPWYAARCVFRWLDVTPETPGHHLYEERIVLFRAESFEEALRRAEDEARDYASSLDMEFLKCVDIFHLFDRKIGDRTEVFSLIRESELPSDEYVQQFFDTGKKRRGEL